jgi:hypothetical protein
MRSIIARLILTGVLLAPAAPAFAIGGLYLQFGLGYGQYGGSELVTEELPNGPDLPETDSSRCCAKGGIAADIRLGYSLFGAAIEGGIIGNGWDIGSDTGGGGLAGGGLRLYVFDLLALADLKLDVPLDLSFGVLFGYTIVGKEFAYNGFGMNLDVQLDYKVMDFLSVGAKLNIGLPTFGDFVYTSYKDDVGRCLDDSARQITSGDNNGRMAKESAVCNGRGPSSTFISPQLVATMHFDLFE